MSAGPKDPTLDPSDKLLRRESLAATTEAESEAGTERIPVVREVVHVEKREVETGRVVVRKTVTEHEEPVEALLRRTDVEVERVPIGRTVTEAPPQRQEGDVLVIPVLEEVLVTEKRLVLKEEIRIRTTSSEQQHRESVRLRREHVEIEGSGSVTTPDAVPAKEA